MTDGDGPMTYLDIGHGPIAGADAVEPVLHVPPRLPERQVVAPFPLLFDHVEFRPQLFRNFRRIGGELVAVDLEFSLLADEDGPAHWAVPLTQDEVHRQAVGVAHSDLPVWPA